MKRLLPLVTLLALTTPAPAHADPPFTGPVYFIDGTNVGIEMNATSSGHVGTFDYPTDLTLVGPDADCDQPHVHGTINGVSEPIGSCGWGRVVPKAKTSKFVRDLYSAIFAEMRAQRILSTGRSTDAARGILQHGSEDLAATLRDIDRAHDNLVLPDAKAAKLRRKIKRVQEIDRRLENDLSANSTPSDTARASYVARLDNAISIKRAAFNDGITLFVKEDDSADALAPCAGAGGGNALGRAEALSCSITQYWDINVPKGVKFGHCIAKQGTRTVDSAHPIFAGVTQTQTCRVTNRIRTVGGKRKRVVHFEIKLEGSYAGPDVPLSVSFKWGI
jgi:hypothetical protein